MILSCDWIPSPLINYTTTGAEICPPRYLKTLNPYVSVVGICASFSFGKEDMQHRENTKGTEEARRMWYFLPSYEVLIHLCDRSVNELPTKTHIFGWDKRNCKFLFDLFRPRLDHRLTVTNRSPVNIRPRERGKCSTK